MKSPIVCPASCAPFWKPLFYKWVLVWFDDILPRHVQIFTLNGGVLTLEEAEQHLNGVFSASVCPPPDERKQPDVAQDEIGDIKRDQVWKEVAAPHGVMIGRGAYNNPWQFADADRRFFGVRNPGLSRYILSLIFSQNSIRFSLPQIDGDGCKFTRTTLYILSVKKFLLLSLLNRVFILSYYTQARSDRGLHRICRKDAGYGFTWYYCTYAHEAGKYPQIYLLVILFLRCLMIDLFDHD